MMMEGQNSMNHHSCNFFDDSGMKESNKERKKGRKK
jgi:hypothetical protein